MRTLTPKEQQQRVRATDLMLTAFKHLAEEGWAPGTWEHALCDHTIVARVRELAALGCGAEALAALDGFAAELAERRNRAA